MDGIEVLKQELLKAGATKQQVESKTVELVVKVLAENAGLLGDVAEAIIDRAKTAEAKYKIATDNVTKSLQPERDAVRRQLMDLKIESVSMERERKAFEAEKEAFFGMKEQVMSAETDRARDAFRLAKFYIDTVDIDNQRRVTDTERIAYVRKLGDILSGARWNQQEETEPSSETETATSKDGLVKVKRSLGRV